MKLQSAPLDYSKLLRTYRPAMALDELIERLGNVSLDRICCDPSPGRATEEDVIRFLHAGKKWFYELVKNTLIEKPFNLLASVVAARLCMKVGNHIPSCDNGFVTTVGGPFRMKNGNIRLPHLAYIPRSRVASLRRLTKEPISRYAPTLIGIIRCPEHTDAEISMMCDDFFQNETQRIWILNLHEKTAVTILDTGRQRRHGPNDRLTGGRVLAGLSCSMTELFDFTRPHNEPTKG